MKLTYTLTPFAILFGILLSVARAASAEDDEATLNYYNSLKPSNPDCSCSSAKPPTPPPPPPPARHKDNSRAVPCPGACNPGIWSMQQPAMQPNCFGSRRQYYPSYPQPFCRPASCAASTPNVAPTPATMYTPSMTASSAAYSTATGTSFSYLGCVAEGTRGSRRALTDAKFSLSNMTPQLCQLLCSEYRFAGVEYGTECYCGNSLRNNGASGSLVSESNCHLSCSGDPGKTCGGHWSMSVYTKSTSPPPANQRNSGACFEDIPSLPPPPTCADNSQAVPFLRAYNPETTDHFYTTSALEFNNAVRTLGYTDRGSAGHIWTSQQPGTVPLYRLWNSLGQDHFYTISAAERDNAVASLKYTNEGIAGFAYPGRMCGATRLYRLFSPSRSDHLYTQNKAERLGLTQPGASTYIEEGISAYILA